METTRQIFVPQIEADKVIIKEVDVEEIFKLTYDHFKVDGSVNLQKYDGFTVNFGNDRYRALDQTRRCKCCNIKTTHAFLEHDKDNDGNPITVFNFYAETKDKPNTDTSHLVKMIETDQGIVCVTCGWIINQLQCSIFDVQQIMFNAYRSYRSSLTLRLSDETLKPAFSELKKNRKLVENVTQGLTKARPEAHEAMRAKIVEAEARIAELEPRIDAARIKAQQTGMAVAEYEVSKL